MRQALGGKERENASGAGDFSIKNKNNHKLITTSNNFHSYNKVCGHINFQFKQQLKKLSETKCGRVRFIIRKKQLALRLKEKQYEEVLRNKYGQWSCSFEIKVCLMKVYYKQH